MYLSYNKWLDILKVISQCLSSALKSSLLNNEAKKVSLGYVIFINCIRTTVSFREFHQKQREVQDKIAADPGKVETRSYPPAVRLGHVTPAHTQGHRGVVSCER